VKEHLIKVKKLLIKVKKLLINSPYTYIYT
jgi:hypothetical protein